ncbi:MAG: class I SAM-dependent methyltransferase [Gammaproteobacteria bacterium]|nr:class I SAM-dependent methyltransferase [Gammaproteobacteria bacterium]MBT8436424.1 class I SAM-dependent methyltransferase [Gammaproteobacteria bacterium]
MSSVSYHEDNYEKYDWAMADEEWSAPWGGTRSMWLTSIFPRIGQFLPADRIVEIGCGYGKIAKVLHAFTASELVLLDITDDCIEKCALAFEESSKTRCLKTDGRSLQGVANNSVDLVFSFYSLVGTNADTMQAYLQECGRVLRDDGAAFLHHSNVGMYYQDKNTQVDKRIYSLAANRDILVDAATVQAMADDNNLICIKQECISWDIEEVLGDCFSTLVRPDSKWAQDPELIHNPDFHNERKHASKRTFERRIRTDETWGIL